MFVANNFSTTSAQLGGPHHDHDHVVCESVPLLPDSPVSTYGDFFHQSGGIDSPDGERSYPGPRYE